MGVPIPTGEPTKSTMVEVVAFEFIPSRFSGLNRSPKRIVLAGCIYESMCGLMTFSPAAARSVLVFLGRLLSLDGVLVGCMCCEGVSWRPRLRSHDGVRTIYSNSSIESQKCSKRSCECRSLSISPKAQHWTNV